MQFLDSIVSFLNNILWSYVLIVVLVGAGIWFTFSTRCVQLRHLPEMIRLLGEGATSRPVGKGHISTFQAFCVSTASRVGVGNIAGIALAVAIGGPGAVFWMWLICLLGSATGFVESTLAQIYKSRGIRGGFVGGPAFYIEKALGSRVMAVLFAILISITFGLIFNSVQANTISLSLQSAFGFDRTTTGLTVALLTSMVIFGGLTRIAKAAAIMVPPMAIAYLCVALVVTVMNLDMVPMVIAEIFRAAFDWHAVGGAGLATAMLTGIKRGLFSNEAGMGSVPNAAAAADASHPVKQGLIQALGVFVDTLLVCTASAMIVLLSPDWASSKMTGIELAQHALAGHLGDWAGTFLSIIIFFFAFSSIIGNYFYGEINLAFLKAKMPVLNLFRFGVVLMVVFGSIAELQLVWNLADLFMALLALTNLVAILFLGKFAFIALHDYFDQKKAGVKEPQFDPKVLPTQNGIECWPRSAQEAAEEQLVR